MAIMWPGSLKCLEADSCSPMPMNHYLCLLENLHMQIGMHMLGFLCMAHMVCTQPEAISLYVKHETLGKANMAKKYSCDTDTLLWAVLSNVSTRGLIMVIS